MTAFIDWMLMIAFIFLSKINNWRIDFEQLADQPTDPLYLTHRPHDAVAKIGDAVVLECGTREQTKVNWYLNGVRVNPGGNIQSNDLIVISEDNGRSSLLIKKLLPSLGGRYHCKVYNKEVAVRKGAWVNVTNDCAIEPQKQDMVDITKNPGDYFSFGNAATGAAHTLWTKSSYKSPYKLTFYEVAPDVSRSRISVSANGTHYITSLNILDEGLWTEISLNKKWCIIRKSTFKLKIENSQAGDCGYYDAYIKEIDDESSGVTPQSPSGIIGGRDAKKGSAPWFASLCFKGNARAHCGASLINEKWIVTAAHCLYDTSRRGHGRGRWFETDEITVKLGSLDPVCDVNKDWEIKRIELHQKAKNGIPIGNYTGDIALIELETEVAYKESVRPVCLESSTFYADEGAYTPGKLGTVHGLGLTSEEPRTEAKTLQSVLVPIVAHEDCEAATNYHVDEYTICAGFKEGGKDACKGDSGGPYTMQLQGRSFLVGAVSWGYKCATAGKYGYYTNVGKFFEWIRETVNKTTVTPTPDPMNYNYIYPE